MYKYWKTRIDNVKILWDNVKMRTDNIKMRIDNVRDKNG